MAHGLLTSPLRFANVVRMRDNGRKTKQSSPGDETVGRKLIVVLKFRYLRNNPSKYKVYRYKCIVK